MAFSRKKSLVLTLLLSLIAALILVPLKVLRRHAKDGPAGASSAAPTTVGGIPPGIVWGIDVSHHQRTINWSRLVTKPGFIFLKSTEGVSHVDTRFKSYYKKSRQHGIPTGAYHFFSFRASGKEQARHFIRNTTLASGDLPPVLDVEWARRLPSPQKIAKEVNAWLLAVENHYRVPPILYTDEQFYNAYLKGRINKKYKLWLCDYKNEPRSRWVFWQRTDRFTLEGIKGTVDLNYFQGSAQQLADLTLQ